MIYGIGTDIVATQRVTQALERFGERFVARILAHEERNEFMPCSGEIVRFDCPLRAHCRVANCLRENNHAAQFAPCIASRREQSNPDNFPRARHTAHHSPARFLAKRFAAKEAFAKALGTGIRYPATLHNIRVGHDSLGKPSLAFHATLASELEQRGIRNHHLSLSDEQDMAVAFVILES